MHILGVHNHYQIRGGEEECFKAEVGLLRQNGHQVDLFEETNDRVAQLGSLQTLLRTFWSGETYRTVRQRLTAQRYNVVHVQNFFPLISPSVYYAAKDRGVPVVQTLHNYRLVCPNAQLFREGHPCEACLQKSIPLPGIIHACYRGDRTASGVTAAMLMLHRLLNTWTETVDRYIALTEFARDKFIEGGLPADKIVVKPNFVADPGMGSGSGGYALYVGRLATEKGIDLLLRSWQTIGKTIPLKIVGDGPMRDQVIEATETIEGVEWLGRRSLAEVYHLMGEAKMLIFPSLWYEGLPRTIIESFATGTPVIAADLGAMSRLVTSGETGLHFTAGSQESLAAQVEWAAAHPHRLSEMRHQARIEYKERYTAEANYEQLMQLYHSLA
jgi:glycosyltransferase involved in cell wall biosynthesis